MCSSVSEPPLRIDRPPTAERPKHRVDQRYCRLERVDHGEFLRSTSESAGSASGESTGAGPVVNNRQSCVAPTSCQSGLGGGRPSGAPSVWKTGPNCRGGRAARVYVDDRPPQTLRSAPYRRYKASVSIRSRRHLAVSESQCQHAPDEEVSTQLCD
jgi:hypothetical protein